MGIDKPATAIQPPPTPGRARVWDLVRTDIDERDRMGRAKYGTPLEVGNGRNPQVDAYQEALDLVVYHRQAIAERAEMEALIEAIDELVPDYMITCGDCGGLGEVIAGSDPIPIECRTCNGTSGVTPPLLERVRRLVAAVGDPA